MQIKRTASAQWTGSGKEGKGTLTTASTVLQKTAYSYQTRFENGVGTNPEELIAAAHAGCFSMKLAFNLQAANFVADSIDTKATVVLENGSITEVHLDLQARIPGIDQATFSTLATDAKANCPVSKLLNATLFLTASLL